MKNYRTINKIVSSEYKVKKSKFYGYIKPIENKEEAETFIEEISKKHHDARHNVPIYVIGADYNIQKYSDDGEPSGTAGMPILEMLKSKKITNVAVVITRYFGGIKLGTGGLLRAYLTSATLAIDESEIVEKRVFRKVSFLIDYTLHGKIVNYIKNNDSVELDEESFFDKVEINLFIKLENFDKIEKDFINLSSGQIKFKQLGKFYLSFMDDKRIK
jgi:uncharacterized YigZ family protein